VFEGRGDQKENIQAFLRILDPGDDATGGGTASAVAGAMAAGLAGMVARLSMGGRGTEEEAYYRAIDREARTLAADLFAGGRRDSEAFEAVQASRRLPAGTEQERGSRKAAIRRALIHATRIPLENGEACRRVLELCRRLEGRCNPNAASDLECAGHLARAGLLGCLANVEINLSSIKDERTAAALGEAARELRRYATTTHWTQEGKG